MPTDLIDQINKISSSFRFSYDSNELVGNRLYKFQVLFRYGPENTEETYRLTVDYILQSDEPIKIYTTSNSRDIIIILKGYADGYLRSAKVEREDSFYVDDNEIVRYIMPSELRNFSKDLIVSLIDILKEFPPKGSDYLLNHFYNAVRNQGILVGDYKILV